jgi:hypothetical protein
MHSPVFAVSPSSNDHRTTTALSRTSKVAESLGMSTDMPFIRGFRYSLQVFNAAACGSDRYLVPPSAHAQLNEQKKTTKATFTGPSIYQLVPR